MTKLVIVESPAKGKKIQSYLPKEYVVDSCVGHIRDLPAKKSELPAAIKDKEWGDYAVDYTNDFKPYYVTIRGKNKIIQQLKKKLKDADELYLATDEDREGESISWHLLEMLKPKVPVHRMVFNEITKEAILGALENTREVDVNLVQAQETRRILDRLYGYTLSPLLWKKVGGNLSAGRVQSVAVRLVVMRERERRAFKSGSYWDLKASLLHPEDPTKFPARLVTLDGKPIATGDDFDKDTGRLKEGSNALLLEEAQARELQTRLLPAPWNLHSLDVQERRKTPDAPFTTSTLQQEANNRLDLPARETMRIAQRLYENGLITYMRTDSTELSEEAIAGAAAAVAAEFGANLLSPKPRKYSSKKSKGAQEAHEAIRPAGKEFQHPDRAGMSGPEKQLYTLIWQRTLASQMIDERFAITTANFAVEEAIFQSKGRETIEPGFRAVYPFAGKVTPPLPSMHTGDQVTCQALDAEGHETKPPARFTEATLVRALESEGIGRPSTYAAILDTIVRRNYVHRRGKALVPSFTAFAVVGLLEDNFPQLIDTKFTAGLEEDLDEIAAGEEDFVKVLGRFFLGEDGLKADVERHMESMDPATARIVKLEGLPCQVKIGRFGPYIEMTRDGEQVTASLPDEITPDELDEELIERLIKQKAEGPESLGTDPETSKPIYLLSGRFGPYVQLGDADGGKPPRSSLPKGMKPEDVDQATALFLLSLPKQLGEHPDGGTVSVGLGRFGPFVVHEKDDKKDYRNLKDFDEVKACTLEDALALLAVPKKGRGGGRGPTVLKDLGKHPGDGQPIQLLDGRYGPYVKHGKTNASIPKDADPAGITVEIAMALIEARKNKK